MWGLHSDDATSTAFGSVAPCAWPEVDAACFRTRQSANSSAALPLSSTCTLMPKGTPESARLPSSAFCLPDTPQRPRQHPEAAQRASSPRSQTNKTTASLPFIGAESGGTTVTLEPAERTALLLFREVKRRRMEETPCRTIARNALLFTSAAEHTDMARRALAPPSADGGSPCLLHFYMQTQLHPRATVGELADAVARWLVAFRHTARDGAGDFEEIPSLFLPGLLRSLLVYRRLTLTSTPAFLFALFLSLLQTILHDLQWLSSGCGAANLPDAEKCVSGVCRIIVGCLTREALPAASECSPPSPPHQQLSAQESVAVLHQRLLIVAMRHLSEHLYERGPDEAVPPDAALFHTDAVLTFALAVKTHHSVCASEAELPAVVDGVTNSLQQEEQRHNLRLVAKALQSPAVLHHLGFLRVATLDYLLSP